MHLKKKKRNIGTNNNNLCNNFNNYYNISSHVSLFEKFLRKISEIHQSSEKTIFIWVIIMVEWVTLFVHLTHRDNIKCILSAKFNLFHPNISAPLKTSGNLYFSDVFFGGYRMGNLIENALIFNIFLFCNFTLYPRYSNVKFEKDNDNALRLEEKLDRENRYWKLTFNTIPQNGQTHSSNSLEHFVGLGLKRLI